MPPAIHIAVVLALGLTAQWVAWRLRLPAIVLLLLFGAGLGYFYPASPNEQNQEFFFALVSMAVGIILFEGGLSLKLAEIRETGGVVFRLVTVGLLLTWLLTAAFAHWLADFSVPTALLMGAVLTVSGPTVVLPLLRHVQPVRRVGSLTKWEGIVNDPIGAVLAAVVFEVVVHLTEAGDFAFVDMLRTLAMTAFWGILISVLGATFLLFVLRRYLVPDYLQNPLILAFVLLVFAVSNQIQHEAGLITVTVMGVILANQKKVELRHVVEFKENLSVLLISTLFIVLASRLDLRPETLAQLGWGSVGLLAAMVVVVRPLATLVSTVGSSLSWPERAFLAWIHPRGIVAAAVSSLLALQITIFLGEEYADAALVQEAKRFELVTFMAIVGTVAIYGLTLAPVARLLGLSRQNPQGILFAGASKAVREIAAAVKAEGIAVLLVDTNPRNNSAARMAGLPVTHASVGSEFVQEEIDLGGIGRLLAMTPNDEVNTLAAMGFAERFSRAEVYQTASPEPSSGRTERTTAYRRGRPLFSRPVTIDDLERRLAEGQRVKATPISEDFSFDDFLERYGEDCLVLFIVDEEELIVATEDQEAVPKAGQKVIALVNEQDDEKRGSQQTLS